ncbi:hypothetical protein JZ751_012144 [Albula glossodonta]|uniref:Surfactant protein Ba n=1 Tax=Albula glossodonta TaxID=121402 RepID=A0A8T2PRN1_9TELE|nr:hypothetical protein JZ751_012144 [Albula glossodonta]
MAPFKFAFLVFIALDSSALAGVIDAQSARDEWSEMQDTCKDCTQIMELLADMLKNADTQDLIKKALEDLCKLLPGTKAQNLCVEQVEKNLPMAIKLLTAFIKPSQICTSIGLCKGQSQGMEEELLTNLIANFHIAPGTGTMSELVEFLLSWATPQRVCSLLRLCSSQDDCYSCQTLAVLARFHLGSNTTELQTSSFLESVCMLHPSAIPELHPHSGHPLLLHLHSPPYSSSPTPSHLSLLCLYILPLLFQNSCVIQLLVAIGSACLDCESFTQHHRPALQRALAKPVGILDLCEGALLCAAVTETGVKGRDPCSRGALYRCRDQKTAKECNSVSFCEKYVWQ